MSGEELLELKFRLYDGTDIGPNKFAPATTVATLKESIISQWPQGTNPFITNLFLLVYLVCYLLPCSGPGPSY